MAISKRRKQILGKQKKPFETNVRSNQRQQETLAQTVERVGGKPGVESERKDFRQTGAERAGFSPEGESFVGFLRGQQPGQQPGQPAQAEKPIQTSQPVQTIQPAQQAQQRQLDTRAQQPTPFDELSAERDARRLFESTTQREGEAKISALEAQRKKFESDQAKNLEATRERERRAELHRRQATGQTAAQAMGAAQAPAVASNIDLAISQGRDANQAIDELMQSGVLTVNQLLANEEQIKAQLGSSKAQFIQQSIDNAKQQYVQEQQQQLQSRKEEQALERQRRLDVLEHPELALPQEQFEQAVMAKKQSADLQAKRNDIFSSYGAKDAVGLVENLKKQYGTGSDVEAVLTEIGQATGMNLMPLFNAQSGDELERILEATGALEDITKFPPALQKMLLPGVLGEIKDFENQAEEDAYIDQIIAQSQLVEENEGVSYQNLGQDSLTGAYMFLDKKTGQIVSRNPQTGQTQVQGTWGEGQFSLPVDTGKNVSYGYDPQTGGFQFSKPSDKKIAGRVDRRECAAYVNDMLGTSMGDSNSEKRNYIKNNGLQTKEPVPGGFFVYDVPGSANKYGHTGLISNVERGSNGEVTSVYITDSNGDGKYGFRTNYKVPIKDMQSANAIYGKSPTDLEKQPISMQQQVAGARVDSTGAPNIQSQIQGIAQSLNIDPNITQIVAGASDVEDFKDRIKNFDSDFQKNQATKLWDNIPEDLKGPLKDFDIKSGDKIKIKNSIASNLGEVAARNPENSKDLAEAFQDSDYESLDDYLVSQEVTRILGGKERAKMRSDMITDVDRYTAPFDQMDRNLSQMQTALQRIKDNPGDLKSSEEAVIIINQLKALDPDSAVMEGEFKRAGNNQSLVDKFNAFVNKPKTGGTLSINELEDIVKTTEAVSREYARFAKDKLAPIEEEMKFQNIDRNKIFSPRTQTLLSQDFTPPPKIKSNIEKAIEAGREDEFIRAMFTPGMDTKDILSEIEQSQATLTTGQITESDLDFYE